MGLLPSEADAAVVPEVAPRPVVVIVEDESAAAELAAELCDGLGAATDIFSSPLPFLRAVNDLEALDAAVLDWRLEQELSAALFMAIRHRFPRLRVIYWTGVDPATLPAMIHEDPLARVVPKAGSTESFEDAVRWALDGKGWNHGRNLPDPKGPTPR